MELRTKKAIIIVAFGTSSIEGINKFIYPFKAKIEENFSEEYECYISLTSNFILKKLRQNYNVDIKNFEEIMEGLMLNGYEEVIICPLYFSHGREYNKIKNTYELYKDKFKKINITSPILKGENNIIYNYKDKYECIIFIGHGTNDDVLDDLEEYMENFICKNDFKNIYYLLINKKEKVFDLIKNMKANNIKNVTLIPLLITKGHHYRVDITSKEEKSFYKILTDNGFNVEITPKVIGEEEFFRELVVEKIKRILNNK